MNGAEWEPGDVAYLRYRYAESGPAVRVDGCDQGHPDGPHWHFFDGRSGGGTMATEIRRLVLIDPEDAGQVARLAQCYIDANRTVFISLDTAVGNVRNALREFARPTPRIEEPPGLGAVVEDRDGDMWTRRSSGLWEDLSGPPGDCRPWANLSEHYAPLRVLSHGVTEGAS